VCCLCLNTIIEPLYVIWGALFTSGQTKLSDQTITHQVVAAPGINYGENTTLLDNEKHMEQIVTLYLCVLLISQLSGQHTLHKKAREARATAWESMVPTSCSIEESARRLVARAKESSSSLARFWLPPPRLWLPPPIWKRLRRRRSLLHNPSSVSLHGIARIKELILCQFERVSAQAVAACVHAPASFLSAASLG
jgi:hypothetical protein